MVLVRETQPNLGLRQMRYDCCAPHYVHDTLEVLESSLPFYKVPADEDCARPELPLWTAWLIRAAWVRVQDALARLVEMGFDAKQATAALLSAKNQVR